MKKTKQQLIKRINTKQKTSKKKPKKLLKQSKQIKLKSLKKRKPYGLLMQ